MTEQLTTETSQNNITLQDLGLAVQIIDTCTKRGAFEGTELSSVGTLRDKLERFINAHANALPASAPEAEETVQELDETEE